MIVRTNINTNVRNKELEVLYCNLNRSRPAHDIMTKTAQELAIDISCCSEPNWTTVSENGWTSDTEKATGIKITSNKTKLTARGGGNGHCWIALADAVVVYSCYISPNTSFQCFQQSLQDLGNSLRNQAMPSLIFGDFNAKSRTWGSRLNDERGKHLLEWAANNDLVILNDGRHPTFSRGGSESFLDLTLITTAAARRVTEWAVMKDLETLSDHHYIRCKIACTDSGKDLTRKKGYRRPNESELSKLSSIASGMKRIKYTPKTIAAQGAQLCNAVLGRKQTMGKRRAVHWWNDEVNEKRTAAVATRRAKTRLFRTANADPSERTQAEERYRECRRELRAAIRRAKQGKYEELLEDLDANPWGTAYRLIKNTHGPASVIKEGDAIKMAAELFPRHSHKKWNRERGQEQTPLFTDEELKTAIRRIKQGKAAGPDGIRPEVAKIILEARQQECLRMYNSCLKREIFPKQWKKAELLLLPKPESEKMRPICLLDTFGKVLERLLVNRLDKCIKTSEHQYGYRAGRSTTAAIEKLMKVTAREKKENKMVCVIALDIKNAFNSAPWKEIISSLERKNVPRYLSNMVKSYLHDRSLMVGDSTLKITSGVPQGSVLGPCLWKALYDGVLSPKIPNAEFVCYADDLALVVSGKERDIVGSCNHAAQVITSRLERIGLEVAAAKTKAVLLNSRGASEIKLVVGGNTIRTVEQIKYLGFWLAKDLKIRPHIELAAAKGGKAIGALARIMPKTYGPSQRTRLTLARAALSSILYAAPIWAGVLTHQCYVNMLRKESRPLLLRACYGHGNMATISAEVISGIVPVHLQAKELAAIYGGTDRSTAREFTMREWQREWASNPELASWTKRLIPDLSHWIKRRHGWTTYTLTQFLSGHGVFRAGLYKCRLTRSPSCLFCHEVDTAEHAIFECRMHRRERVALEDTVGSLSPETVVQKMLTSRDTWRKVEEFVQAVILSKELWGKRD